MARLTATERRRRLIVLLVLGAFLLTALFAALLGATR